MDKVDISSWGEFHLYDIFKIDSGTKLDKVKMKSENPAINFVGRANSNNGITAKVDKISGIEPYQSGNMTLALGGSYLGSCFIQDECFYTSQNVIVLIPKTNITFYAKQFIASVIFKESQLHYKAFLNELNPHIKNDFVIKLPIDNAGTPDFVWMDKYIKDIFIKSIDKKNKFLKIIKKQEEYINISEWKEFKVKNLFDIHPTKNYKLTNNKLFENEGKMPVIVNSSYNNGIGGYVNLSPTEKGNIITFSDTTSSDAIFYQEKEFIGYSHVQGIYPKEPCKWSKYSLLFFLAIFKKSALLLNFDYVNKFTRELAYEIIVKLPTDDNGNPDFDFMENYINRKISLWQDNFNKIQKVKKRHKIYNS